MNAPDELWLLVEDVETDEGVLWCREQINDTDVRYIRADLAQPAPVLVDVPEDVQEARRLADAASSVWTEKEQAWFAAWLDAQPTADGSNAAPARDG